MTVRTICCLHLSPHYIHSSSVICKRPNPTFMLASDKATGDRSFSTYIHDAVCDFRDEANWDFINYMRIRFGTVKKRQIQTAQMSPRTQ